MRNAVRVSSVLVWVLLVVVSLSCNRTRNASGGNPDEKPAEPTGKPVSSVFEPAVPVDKPVGSAVEPAVPADIHEKLRLTLSGEVAQPVAQEKPDPGVSQWRVLTPIDGLPTFKFEISDPEISSKLRMDMVTFHPHWKGRYLEPGAPVIRSANPADPDIQMKPGVEYDLANLGENFTILDTKGEPPKRLALRPGFEYKMRVKFKGEWEYTAEIFFTEKGTRTHQPRGR